MILVIAYNDFSGSIQCFWQQIITLRPKDFRPCWNRRALLAVFSGCARTAREDIPNAGIGIMVMATLIIALRGGCGRPTRLALAV